MLSKNAWETLPTPQKLSQIYDHAMGQERALAALAAIVERLQQQLAAIERKHPGSAE